MTMRYIAAQSAGVTKDYTWKLSREGADTHFKLKDLVDDTAPSVVVFREDDQWHCLIGGIRSSSTDFRGRTNRLTVVFCGLGKDEARRLALVALRDWDACVRELLGAFQWGKAKADDEWTPDFPALERIAMALIDRATLSLEGRPFIDAWERKNTPDDWKKLADELKEQTFSEDSEPAVVKLVVTGAPSENAYNQMLDQADRVLWSADEEQSLTEYRKKKRQPSSPTISKRSKTPSKTSSGEPEGSSTSVVDLIRSNSGLLIACAIAALLLVGMTRCRKKKDFEPQRLTPTPAATPAPTVTPTSPLIPSR